MFRKVATVLGGSVVYIGGIAAAYTYFADVKDSDCPPDFNHYDRLKIYAKNAANYDKEINLDEKLMGITLLRRWLIGKSSGKVLEIAAGTGRNLPYYRADRIKQLTLTDSCEEMLSQFEVKKKELQFPCESLQMDASNIRYPNSSFDTVVDTFGLCSVDDPVEVLKEMQRVCKKNNSRILLLEHGRSHFKWLSFILDKFEKKHASKWGCTWNRDILKIVEESGLEIESSHRFHFGTTYFLVCRPKN